MRFDTVLLQTRNNTGIEIPPDVIEGLRRDSARGIEKAIEKLKL